MFKKKIKANTLSGENLEMGVVTEEILLGWLERLIFFIFGIVPIGEREKNGWTGAVPFFLFRGKCGHIFIDYPHGYNKKLNCPVCGLLPDFFSEGLAKHSVA